MKGGLEEVGVLFLRELWDSLVTLMVVSINNFSLTTQKIAIQIVEHGTETVTFPRCFLSPRTTPVTQCQLRRTVVVMVNPNNQISSQR